jgi:hypothetical protein
MAPYVADLSCRNSLAQCLSKSLQDAHRFSSVLIAEQEPDSNASTGDDTVLTVSLEKWGLWVIGQEGEMMAGFIQMEIKMMEAQTKRLIWDEREISLGCRRHTLESYSRDRELLRADMKELIQEVCSRLSDHLTYPKK